MKKLLVLLFSLFLLSSPSVFADNYIPTIEKIFIEKVPMLDAGEHFYGCIYQIDWGDEDLFKQKRVLSSVRIGNPNTHATLYMGDFFEGDEGTPDIGDCFAFTTNYGLGKLSANQYIGNAKIYYGKYKIDNSASPKELKNQITVDEYFQDNIAYDNQRFTLIGEVEETDVFAYEFYISLVSQKGEQIKAFFPQDKWKNDESMRNKLRSIKMGDMIKLRGYFRGEMGMPVFNILKILD